MVGIAETGVYTVGYQVANIMNIIVMSFNKAYIPWLFGKLKKNNFMDKIRIVKFTYVYFFAVIVLAVSFSLFASWVLKFIVGKNFVNAGAYIIWIALGFAFSGMYYMVTNYILLAEKTHVLAGVTFLAGTINIPLTYVLIKANGTSGAAQATTITFFIHFILTWFLSAKVYKMPWALKQNPIEQ
jgi:O-antigen/teichoic acid export membrane protein